MQVHEHACHVNQNSRPPRQYTCRVSEQAQIQNKIITGVEKENIHIVCDSRSEMRSSTALQHNQKEQMGHAK